MQPKNFIDLTGRRFGRLTVIEKIKSKDYNHTLWLCRCDCGKNTVVDAYKLKKGLTTSCGCFHSERSSANMKKVVKQSPMHTTNLDGTQLYSFIAKRKTSTGIRGVCKLPSGKYLASLKIAGKYVLRKRTWDINEAETWRKEATEKYLKPLLESEEGKKLLEKLDSKK